MGSMPQHEVQRRLEAVVKEDGNWLASSDRIGVSPVALATFLRNRGLRTVDDCRRYLKDLNPRPPQNTNGAT